MEMPKNGCLAVKRYAVCESKNWWYAVCKAKIGQYAVPKEGGGHPLIESNFYIAVTYMYM